VILVEGSNKYHVRFYILYDMTQYLHHIDCYHILNLNILFYILHIYCNSPYIYKLLYIKLWKSKKSKYVPKRLEEDLERGGF